jgi:hypothetical protein
MPIRKKQLPNKKIVHYKLFKQHNPDDTMEPRVYQCSECDDEVWNVNIHAQTKHETMYFDVDQLQEVARIQIASPFHPCGIMGCEFEPHEDGPHSWEVNP